jgi:hypothetical protein
MESIKAGKFKGNNGMIRANVNHQVQPLLIYLLTRMHSMGIMDPILIEKKLIIPVNEVYRSDNII